MEIKIDEDEPEDSMSRYMVDLVCTGDPAIALFYVSSHWHKLRLFFILFRFHPASLYILPRSNCHRHAVFHRVGKEREHEGRN